MTTYDYGNPDAPVVLIQPVDGHDLSLMDSEVGELQRLSEKDFRLTAVCIEHWNQELSPWAAPPVFGREGFGDRAEDTLAKILEIYGDRGKKYIIGGYSLAGLFSVWAAFRTDVFSAAAAASPSLWFPGFIDYMKSHEIMCGRVYLSLGDKESKTRNPVMAAAGTCIQEAYELLKSRGTETVLEWNQGNHFRESDIRTAKAFAWALK